MAWFSPVKGTYPSLQQVDRTLPVASTATTIERGMILKVANGKFEVATNAEGGPFYIALQDYKDAQAGMAGSTWMENGPSTPASAGLYDNGPAITGLALKNPGEYQTDMVDGTVAEGDKLTISNGKLKKTTSDDAVAVATSKSFGRWINDAVDKPKNGNDIRAAVRTGARRTVVQFTAL